MKIISLRNDNLHSIINIGEGKAVGDEFFSGFIVDDDKCDYMSFEGYLKI